MSPRLSTPSATSARRHWLLRLAVMVVFILAGNFATALAAPGDTVRVGFYDLNPLVFKDAEGRPQGLFIDVLTDVSEQEGWQLTFVHGSWSQGLARLDSGEIDLLVSVSHSEERAKTLDFSRDAIVTDWGLLYRRGDSKLESIADLSGARVSVIRNGIYTGHFKRLIEQFDIKMTFVEREGYAQVIADVEAGRSDAGIGSNIAGIGLEPGTRVVRSGIAFAPTKVMFAAKKGAHPELLAAIDVRVGALKADPDSLYFRQLARWVNAPSTPAIPLWVVYAGGGTVLVAGVLALFVLLLKIQVNQKTADLRESEESLAITLHSIGDAVIATDPAGRVTRMNGTAERLCGWSLTEAAGRPLSEVFCIIDADTREPRTDPVQSAMTHGKAVGLADHAMLLARDGREYHIFDSASPIRNAMGRIVGVVLVFSDITERYRVEKELRDSEDRYRSLVERTPDLITRVDEKGRFVFVNNAARDVFGIAPEDCIGLSALDFVHPEDREATQNAFGALTQGRAPSPSFENRQVSRSGSVHHMEWRIVANRTSSGEIIGFDSVARDVTQTRLAERQLLQSRNELSDSLGLLEVTGRIASVGGWSLDVQTRSLKWTQETYRIHEVDPKQPMDVERAIGFYAPSARQVVSDAISACIQTGQAFDLELPLVTASAKSIWVRAQGRAVQQEGKTLQLLGALQDITERKRSQEALRLAASVFSHTREGIMITDPQGAILDVNDAFIRITGFSRDDVLGQNSRILNSGRQGHAFFVSLWRDLIENGHWSGELWNQRKDGALFAALLTISAASDAQGNTQHYVGLFSDITALKEHQHQLEHMAHFDALTNLPNRLLLSDRLQQAMVQSQRRGQQLAVAYIDLDAFKQVNDRHGHGLGDQLLIALATRMRLALREGDTLARIGGDEFVAVLADLTDVADSVPLFTRLLTAAAEPVRIGGLELQVSACLGAAFYPQAQDMDSDQLLRQADNAMFQAKLAGKNRYHIFDAEKDSSIRGHHESLERIRRALEQREFVLHYQPKVNMRTGQVIGAEALIRWQHPELGLLAPGAFLPAIEDHALAVAIGEWVIDTALTQVALWRADGLELGVSVNIGARQLQQANFVDRLRAILANHPRVSPSRLEMEILETSALNDIAQVSEVIDACEAIGITFALDDFGTGYSSLTYLKRLRVRALKIDQSFVRDMLEDPDDLAILEGVIGLATAFKREVIAEGVETVAHGRLLLEMGCELAQGYGIARPMPAHEMPQWSASWRPDPTWLA